MYVFVFNNINNLGCLYLARDKFLIHLIGQKIRPRTFMNRCIIQDVPMRTIIVNWKVLSKRARGYFNPFMFNSTF